MNPPPKHCSSCGRPVPPDAPAELCPACLVAGGFSDEVPLQESKAASTSTLHIVIPEDAAPPNGSPTRLGSYKILERIAQGGMGIVYKARHIGLDRVVALKMIRSGILATPRDVERFQREARSAAKLHHPNIVTIHDIGEQDGQHYFSMDYVPGENLAERARTRPFSPRQAAEITAGVASAIHYAHQQGVLHRDIKPANVILTPEQQPRVLDFGLALVLADDSKLTLSGTPIGSPSYMPPEQAAGRNRSTDARSDVYSLGALLYELLTGRPPFQAASTLETLELVKGNEPVSPRRMNPTLPRDLETICLKCLEKASDRRYQTAQELGDELGRFVRDEPILSRPVSQLEKAWRWCRRKPAQASAIGTGLLLLLVVLIGQPLVTYRINAERKRAEAALEKEAASRQRAETAERESQQQLYIALLEQARATMVSGEMGHRVRALDALRRAAAISNSVELRRELIVALALPDLRFERELSFSADATYAFLDPSFERLALGRGREPVEIRAVSDNRLLATLPASTNLPTFVKHWSADGRFLAVKRDYPDGGRHADWEVWEVASQKRVLLLRNVSADAFSFHPRLPRVIARNPAGVAIWNLEDGQELVRFPLAGRPGLVAFSPDGKRFAAFSPRRQGPDGGRRITVHDATNPDAAELVSNDLKDDVNAVAWHPNGRSLVVPDHGGGVHWVNAQSGEMELLGRHQSRAACAAFTPDGAYFFTGSWGQEVICWDAPTKRPLFTVSLNGHLFQFSADGRSWALNGVTNVQLHAFEERTAHREFAEDLGVGVRWATISPNGRWLAASGDKRIGVWDLSGGGPGALETSGYRAALSFTADGQEMFGSPKEGTSACFRWRLSPPTNASAPPVLTRLPLHTPKGLTSLSPVSNSLVVTSAEGSQILAPGENGRDSGRWVPTSPGFNGVSPDGRWLGIRRPSGQSLYVYRLPQLEEVAKLTHPVSFGEFQFSPRGEEVAIGSLHAGTSVTFWNTTTWQRTRTLTNFCRALYTPDDARALWLLKDWRSAGLYDARTIEPLLLLPEGMLPLALSPDGRYLAVSVDARRLQVWDLAEVRLRLRELGLDWASNR